MKMQVSRVEGAWQWCRAVVVCLGDFDAVSYTHLTLPMIYSVYISVTPVTLKTI